MQHRFDKISGSDPVDVFIAAVEKQESSCFSWVGSAVINKGDFMYQDNIVPAEQALMSRNIILIQDLCGPSRHKSRSCRIMCVLSQRMVWILTLEFDEDEVPSLRLSTGGRCLLDEIEVQLKIKEIQWTKESFLNLWKCIIRYFFLGDILG